LTKRSSGANRESSLPVASSSGPAPFGNDVAVKPQLSSASVGEKHREVTMATSTSKESGRLSKINEQLIKQVEVNFRSVEFKIS